MITCFIVEMNDSFLMKKINMGLLLGFGLFLTSCGGGEKEEQAEIEVNEGRDLVMASIEAHGGSKQWYDNGQLKFRWTYHMTDRGPKAVVDTVQTVDTKVSVLVTHTLLFPWDSIHF